MTEETNGRDAGFAADLTDRMRSMVDRGKRRSEGIVHMRRRNELLREIGEKMYEAHREGDVSIGVSRIEEHLAALETLQSEGDDTES